MFSCKLCSKEYAKRSAMINHISKKHSKQAIKRKQIEVETSGKWAKAKIDKIEDDADQEECCCYF